MNSICGNFFELLRTFSLLMQLFVASSLIEVKQRVEQKPLCRSTLTHSTEDQALAVCNLWRQCLHHATNGECQAAYV